MPASATDAVVVDPWIRRCGCAALAATCVRVAGSYGVGPYPHGLVQVRSALARFAMTLGAADGGWWARTLTGDVGSAATNVGVFAVLPLVMTTAAFVTVYLRLRAAPAIHPRTSRHLAGWAIALAVCQSAAMPMVEDFWVYLAWGRQVAEGLNPYVTTRENYLGMPYGPLWALIGGALYKTAGSIAVAALLGKVLMLVAWLGALALTRRLTRDAPPFAACAAMLIAGWLPLSAEQSVADGHNDILLVFGMLLWLWWMERDRRLAANLALGASVAIKFVSAPLALLSIVRAWRARPRRAAWLLELGVPMLGLAALFAVFGTDWRTLASLWATRGTSGYRIADALAGLSPVIGARASGVLALVARAGFVLTAVAAVFGYARSRSNEAGRVAALALMLAVVFASGWRVFPWYLIWPIAVAAVAADSALSRWTVGVALLFPFVWMRAFLVDQRPFDVSRDGALLLVAYLLGWAWVRVTRQPGAPLMRSA